MNINRIKVDTNLIPNTLEKIMGKNIEPTVKNNGGCVIHRYVVEENSILDIYFNTDGTTSLTPTGKSPEFAHLVAKEISESCSVNLPDPTRALYLKGFSQNELDKILENLGSSGCTNTTLSNTDISKRYQITNSTGENIKIHFFPSTGALNFQGKGYAIYNSILIFLDTFIALEDVIESNLKANNIENITALELTESMKKAFVSSFNFLNGAVANIMSSSFFLTKIENPNLPDYSWMVFPILRGFEGFIKKLLTVKGIRINKNFGEVFEPVTSGSTTYRFLASHTSSLDANYITVLESCYNYLVANRHGVFHIDSIINASRILNRDEAIQLFNDTVELIEMSHSSIFKS